MALRRQPLLALVVILASTGAAYRTQNFTVEAPTPQLAQQVGQAAEYYRKEKAILWTGREMAPWPEPCPLRVTVTMGGSGGATSFAFDRGQVLGQHMHIEGTPERLLASVLPHEVTHTVFAHYFRCPLPRWADEGGAVLSEDDIERNRHDLLVRQILNTPGRAIPLRRLFALHEYPGDVMALYAEGYSVSNFLVGSSNRATFLGFVGHGMQYGWDSAARTYYHYNSVEELEQAWLTQLRNTRRQPTEMARGPASGGAALTGQVVLRQTVPPAQPTLSAPQPVYRGQAPGPDDGEEWNRPASLTPPRPGYLPDYNPTSAARPGEGAPPAPPPAVRFGTPQYLPGQAR
jgi:hypothetical protein